MKTDLTSIIVGAVAAAVIATTVIAYGKPLNKESETKDGQASPSQETVAKVNNPADRILTIH